MRACSGVLGLTTSCICMLVFMPNITVKISWFYLADINICMNYKDTKQTQQTNDWLARNGINVAHVYSGEAELFQATKLATNTLQNWGMLLEQNQAHTLHKFLKDTRCARKRLKIPIARCLNIMNIAKQAQRKSAKIQKASKKHKAS